MEKKRLYAHIFLKNGKAVRHFHNTAVLGNGDAIELAKAYEDNSADALIIFDLSDFENEHEINLGVIKEICREITLPVMAGGNIKRAEDVKKILYAGCHYAILNMSKPSNMDMLVEVSKRFGKEKIMVCNNEFAMLEKFKDYLAEYVSGVILLGDNLHLYEAVRTLPLRTIPILSIMDFPKTLALMKEKNVMGISGKTVSDLSTNLYQLKDQLAQKGIDIYHFESPISWSELKLNSDGLIPTIVQDCQNGQVLMMAYMNEEAFSRTLRTGRMTYWSRSRQKLWIKGETSAHYQQLKKLSIDCDNDTLLAEVIQEGAACHTGNRSCFYRDILKKDSVHKNTAMVFEEVYGVIMDRKENPKEGSYTNYLFDKGIDKILKKVGEEATEIVIAAKNPNPEEIKYEAADFLYHLMVLMAEKSITWGDITEELSKR